MFDPQAVCCSSVFFIIALASLYAGISTYFLMQKIKNTPTSKVRSAALGLVELFGKAKCKDAIYSPISNAKCVYWLIAAEYYQSGKHGGWKSLYRKQSASGFYLEDDTGKMLISSENATVDIPSDFRSEGHLSSKGFLGFSQAQLDGKVLKFLENNPDANSAFQRYSGHNLRIAESFIAEGDNIYVLGTAQQQKDISGNISNENLLVGRGRDSIFYISDSEEKKVVSGMQMKILWPIVIGVVLGCISLFIIISSLI
jgi:hypothetical protein